MIIFIAESKPNPASDDNENDMTILAGSPDMIDSKADHVTLSREDPNANMTSSMSNWSAAFRTSTLGSSSKGDRILQAISSRLFITL